MKYFINSIFVLYMMFITVLLGSTVVEGNAVDSKLSIRLKNVLNDKLLDEKVPIILNITNVIDQSYLRRKK